MNSKESSIKTLLKSIADSPRATKELFVIVAFGLIFIFIVYFDIFYQYGTWLRRQGLKEWRPYDVVYVLAYFGFAFAYFAYRRWQEAEVEVAARLKAEKLKDEFLGMASHELRTPLTTIREGVSQVVDGIHGKTTPEQLEFLKIVLGDIERLSRIINDMLDITKIEAGKFEIRKDRADMVKIAMQAVRLFEPRAETKSLKINALFSRSPIEACVDHDRITQVWYNLLNNAMKFTKKGYVEVSVTDLENHVSCSVRDTGEGIPPEEISHIFNKFYQISGKPVPGEHGTGLGLPIAKAIVESHGGVLSVESTAGEGSIFTFVVPKSLPGM